MLPQDLGALNSMVSTVTCSSRIQDCAIYLSQPGKYLKAKAKLLGSLYSLRMNQVDQALNTEQIASLVF